MTKYVLECQADSEHRYETEDKEDAEKVNGSSCWVSEDCRGTMMVLDPLSGEEDE